MLLATPGEGVETERLQEVRDRPVWLDYQLCRHNDAGEVRWTWRRTSTEMVQLYAELGEELARRRYGEVARTLQRIANQPGFHGVRTQSSSNLRKTVDMRDSCLRSSSYRKLLMGSHWRSCSWNSDLTAGRIYVCGN